MDKLKYYRSTIEKILTEYYELSLKGRMALDESETDSRLAFDEVRKRSHI